MSELKEKIKNKDLFRFQQFSIQQDCCVMKVGTDGVLLGAWAPIPANAQVLDVGTGTGLISLMIAQRHEDTRVIAVEIDEAAAQQAAENVNASPFKDRIEVRRQSIQDFSRQFAASFDLIISNPPFFSGGILSEQEGRANVRHTVKLSHQDLLRSVQRLMNDEGSFCVVLPWLEGLRFQEVAATYKLHTHRMVKVRPNPEKSANRVLLELKKTPAPERGPVIEDIHIYARNGADAPYSLSYQELTQAFYLPANA